MDSVRRHWNVIDNVVTRARGSSSLTGHPERRLENITISNLQLYMEPEDVPDKRSTDAIQVSGVSGLNLRDVSVKWEESKPEEKRRSALTLKDVTGIEIDNFTARQGRKGSDAPVIALENVADGILRNLRASEGAGAFLEFRAGNKELWTHSNELSKAAKRVVYLDAAQRKLIKS